MDGKVDYLDLWGLWAHLTKPHAMIVVDLDLLDIDRDSTADWIDLGLLGDYLYGSKANPHGIGDSIAPVGPFNIELVFVEGAVYTDAQEGSCRGGGANGGRPSSPRTWPTSTSPATATSIAVGSPGGPTGGGMPPEATSSSTMWSMTFGSS